MHFFVIWCPQSDKPITRKFTSLTAAMRVVEKMKSDNQFNDYHILCNLPNDILKEYVDGDGV